MESHLDTTNRHDISHSMAHYLKAIHECVEEFGYSRVTDIAKKLNLKKSSVSIQIARLKRKGLISVDSNKHIKLSSSGRMLSIQCFETKDLLFKLFHQILQVPEVEANEDACAIEHQLSKPTVQALEALVEHLGQFPMQSGQSAAAPAVEVADSSL